MAVSEPQELGKEVVVMSSWSTVQHQKCRGVRRPVLTPVEWYGCACCAALCRRSHLGEEQKSEEKGNRIPNTR
jgi:hypothetical protein